MSTTNIMNTNSGAFFAPPPDARAVTIYEQTSRGERPYDIYSRLLADRIISWACQ